LTPLAVRRAWKNYRFALLFVAAVLFAATGRAGAENLKVPFAALSPTYAPLWIAAQTGYFKKYGLDIQPVYISAGSVILPALLSGQVEIANMSSAPALTAWARGAELASIGVTSNRLLHVIMTRAPMKRPEDLKGKKLGSDPYGSLSDIVLRDTLRHFNLVPNRDVAIIQAGGLPERLGAIKAGAVDGAILSGDTAIQAERLGYHLLVDVSRLPIQYPGSTIVVSRATLQGKREMLKRFLRGWLEGIKTARTDKELTVAVLQKYLKSADREILDRLFEIYKEVQEKIPAPDARVMGVALKQLGATVPQANQLRVEDFIDGSLVRELESEGFIAKLYGARS
jgi:NitT/TauT family transport system substrate-binding protein